MKVSFLLALAFPLGVVLACGADTTPDNVGDKDPVGFGGDGGITAPGPGEDPTTCEEAKAARSYVGCDFWPTVTPTIVNSVFDFAVAVANVGKTSADVTVTGPGGLTRKVTVAAGGLEKIYLPWVTSLKGPDEVPNAVPAGTVLAKSGAYHLVSSRPVIVNQFSPIEFKSGGGPAGKDWSVCDSRNGGFCYSFTSDASLLLPSTAMTGNYRVMGSRGHSFHPIPEGSTTPDLSEPLINSQPSFFAVTATQDGTNVKVKLGAKASIVGGGGISGAPAGGAMAVQLNAGDVALVTTEIGAAFDVSGSLITADKPVQTIAGVACINIPLDSWACDHIEETVFPAETLGKHYVVTRPTGPKQNTVSHVVRFYGNVDGTQLTYKPSAPSGCPATLKAGEMVECGVVASDFEVTGDHEFGVGIFMLGGQFADPDWDPATATVGGAQGDPSQSFAVTVEQYRKHYVFLAPSDYKSSFVDVIASAGTKLTLDGQDVSSRLVKIVGTEWYLARVQLGAGQDGTHVLDASAPVGLQVSGYGDYTSYQYPGGLNLGQIAAPPVK